MISENLLIECGLCFVTLMEADKLDDFVLSERTKMDLVEYLDTGKKPIVSRDILVNCLNNGLEYKKSFSIARRFSSLKFDELAHISDDKILECDGIGKVTVNRLRQVLKPKEIEQIQVVPVKQNDGREYLIDTMLPTKVVTALNEEGIHYVDELRMLNVAEINEFYKALAEVFYDVYLEYGTTYPQDYIPNVVDYVINAYAKGLNNFVRHGYRHTSKTFNYIRYFVVYYLNELLFKLSLRPQCGFEFFDGDVQNSVNVYNRVFNSARGFSEYDKSRDLLNEAYSIADVIKSYVKR